MIKDAVTMFISYLLCDVNDDNTSRHSCQDLPVIQDLYALWGVHTGAWCACRCLYEQESTVCMNKNFPYLHVPVDCTRTGCVYTSHLFQELIRILYIHLY